MQAKHLSLLLGGAAALIATADAQAGFLGVIAQFKANPHGLTVLRVYAVFDRPGEDEMQAVFGTTDSPLSIEVLNGTFFQSPEGTDLAPLDALIEASPMLGLRLLRHDRRHFGWTAKRPAR